MLYVNWLSSLIDIEVGVVPKTGAVFDLSTTYKVNV